MRCPDCQKFVSMDTAGADECVDVSIEIDSLENSTVSVACEVRVTRVCADCGTELKELTFDIEETLEVTLAGRKLTEDELNSLHASLDDVDTSESGGGRYAKNIISFDGTIEVYLDKVMVGSVKVGDSAAASAFEECC